MKEYADWEPFSWYCPNCGALVTGYKNAQGDIKLVCDRCKIVMIRKFHGRRHDTIDMVKPAYNN